MAPRSRVSLLIRATWIQSFVSFAFYDILIAFDGRQGHNMSLLLAVGQVICQWNNWTWHAFAHGYVFAQTTSWSHDFLPPLRRMLLTHAQAQPQRARSNHVPCTQLHLAQGEEARAQESCVTHRGCRVDWRLGASRGEESHYKKQTAGNDSWFQWA